MELRSINKNQSRLSTSILWYPSKRCNFNCSYCADALHDRHSNLLDSNQWDIALNHFSKLDTEISLHISGGEPLLHKDFPVFLQKFRDLTTANSSVGVTSNGSLPASLYIELLASLNYLTISAHLEYINDEKFLQKLLVIQEESKDWDKMTINLMFLPNQLERIQFLSAKLNDAGINYIVRKIRSKNSKESKTYSDDELNFIKTFYLERTTPRHIDVSIKEPEARDFKDKQIPLDKITAFGLNNFQEWTCEAGLNNFTIWNNGEVYPCEPDEGVKSYGNFLEKDFNWPEKSTLICPKKLCVCTADIMIPKWKSESAIN